MVQVDLNNILAVSPEILTSQEKDDMYENIVWIDIEPDLPAEKLGKLFGLAKEILKYKGEQVESLLADLDVLASNSGIGVEEIRDELVKANRQIEQLGEELKIKDKEFENGKVLVEKLSSQVSELQREKNELRREMILIQNEVQANMASGLCEETTEDLNQIKENLQNKNKHILQLLNDTEVLEKENEMLTQKLNSIRRELNSATSNLTKVSGENISLREANYELREKVTLLEERNVGLTSQVSELVAEKNRKDVHLDQLIDALEERVVKWQEVFAYKENEVAELRSKLNELSLCSENKTTSQFATNYTMLSKTIEQQEEMIEQLQQQLKQAGDDLNKSSAEMQDFKKHTDNEPKEESIKKVEELQDELDKALAQLTLYQEKVKDAEQDAQYRAEEMTELIIQLREYEEGVYGLAEARAEVKDLKRQVAVRDKQILNLVQQFHAVDIQADNMDVGEITEDEEKSGTLRLELNQIQQTAINLSVQNFDLRAQVKRLNEEFAALKAEKVEDSKPETDTNEHEEKLHLLIEENEGLRKGLHEVLESIQNQDGSSKVSIESECLERLLEVLDSRHVNGWYHPAMRLQAALNKLQGNNDALRQQLRESRFRESYFQAELQTAFMRIGELEEKSKEQLALESHIPVPAPRRIMESPEDNPKDEPRFSPHAEKEEKEQPISSQGSSSSRRCSESDKSNVTYTVDVEETNFKSFVEISTQTENDINSKETAVQTQILLSRQPSVQKDIPNIETDVVDVPERSDTNLDVNKRVDIIKNELETIKQSTELALVDLTKSKEMILEEVKEAMKKVTNQLEAMKNEPPKVVIPPVTEMVGFKEQEEKLQLYGQELVQVRKYLDDKEKIVVALESQVKTLQDKLGSKQKEGHSDKRVMALKETVKGLQGIVQQKEGVINRLQNMIEESNNEYSTLQDEYKKLEMKVLQPDYKVEAESKAVTVLMEKWIEKVNSLEANIQNLTEKLNIANISLIKAKRETDKWKELANSSTVNTNDQSLLASKDQEIEELKLTIKDLKTDIENEVKGKLKTEISKIKKKEGEFIKKEKENEKEIQRLKHQLNIRSSKSASKLVKKEFILLDKIKELEEEVAYCKNREKTSLQMRKDRCADEVSKWEERKKLQASTEKYKNELREKGVQMELLEQQISRLKQIIARMERERVTLQRRLKLSEGMLEKTILGQEVKDLDEKEYMSESRLEIAQSHQSWYKFMTYTYLMLISVLRSRTESPASDIGDQKINLQSRKDLIRALGALRKVVDKLKAQRANYVRKDYVERLQKEFRIMEENYMDAVERAASLEEQLRESESKFCGQTYVVDQSENGSAYNYLKEQLTQKCELLSKVKVLLQRAMLREKQLIQQVTLLEKLVPPDKLVYLHKEEREL